MQQQRGKFTSLLFLLIYFILKISAVSTAETTIKGTVRVAKSSDRQLIFKIDAHNYRIKNKKVDGQLLKVIEIPDFAQSLEPNEPQLPVKTILFAMPPSAHATLHVQLSDPISLGSINLATTPALDISQKIFPNGNVKISSDKIVTIYSPDKHRQSHAFYPLKQVVLDTSIYFRGTHLGRIRFYPVRQNLKSGETEIFTKAIITVKFSSSEKLPRATSYRWKSSPFERIIKSSIFNDQHSFSLSDAGKIEISQHKNYYLFSENDWYKIFINDDAIYRIGSNELSSAGLPLSEIDPRNIHIFNKGVEVPVFISGEKDGRFDEKDYIEFFGASEKGRYTKNNIYWLTVSGERGKRMVPVDSYPDSTYPIVKRSVYKKHYEKNELYYASIPNGETEDHWFWEKLTAPAQKEIEFYLNDLVEVGSLPAKFSIELRGVTYMPANPDHHADIFLNGEKILTMKWDGQTKRQGQATIFQENFREGRNVLMIDLPGDTEAAADVILLNWFKVEFWRNHNARDNFFGFWGRDIPGAYHYEIKDLSSDEMLVYDITDSLNMRKFINFRYEDYGSSKRLTFQDSVKSRHYLVLSPQQTKTPALIEKDHFSQLLSENNQADYIIITHRNFEQSIAPLANHRQNQGLNVVTVRVDDIYDEFNYGIKDPAAIKDFLGFAYFHWMPPAPTYVLLVGDASYDFRNNTGTSLADYMPTHLFESQTIHTETSSDNWYVCLQGEDNLPEMFIGRLPVRSNHFLDLIVNKIINYEASPPPGRWTQKTIFVADNQDNGGPFEDVSESFISNYLPSDFDVLRVYLRNYLSENQARDAIINGVNYGCLLINYLGHGSPTTWATENIFNSTDVLSLNNGDKLPILVTMSCMNGYFQHAQNASCLAEEFLNSSMGGAVACISPSGFGYTAADKYLGDGLYQALLQDRDNVLGSVVTQGKLSIFASSADLFSDHIDFYNLFGDPALKINIPNLSIEVKPQWNLISLPRVPQHAEIDSVLKQMENNWLKIMTFENNRWIGADAQIPSEFWTLKKLKIGQGYWLQSVNEGAISAQGTEKATLIPLFSGWNLIGFPSAREIAVAEALDNASGNWQKILHFEDNHWYGADASLPQQFWTMDKLKPGAGYWINVDHPDTLIFSRIPTNGDEPQSPLLSSRNKTLPAKKQLTQSTLAISDPEEYYKLTVPKPSGYFGRVYVRNLPAPPGTRISAWAGDKYLPPEAIVKNDGKFNLFLVSGDNPRTASIEGASKGQEIIFKIHLPTGEIFQSDTRGIWEEAINHHLDLFALSDFDSLKTPLKIQFRVNDKIVNEEIAAGDPIPVGANIFISITSEQIPLKDEDVRIFLDDHLLNDEYFEIRKFGDQHSSQFQISLPANNFETGVHCLKASIYNAGLFPNDRYAEFNFQICSDLSLEKIVNFPNPMRDVTRFTYYLLNKSPAQVKIKIYTVSGRLIRTIRDAAGDVGYNETFWDGTDEFGDPIANGVYFYRIIAEDNGKKIERVEKLAKIQ